jgi:exopolyphosphatase/guanosine-5'-triphosphate,3'-diphosphate pyrophosphatase
MAFATGVRKPQMVKVVALIKKKADIKIEIIDGKKGGSYNILIYIIFTFGSNLSFFFVDVGGGVQSLRCFQMVNDNFKIFQSRNSYC